jgi:hypothetical protein
MRNDTECPMWEHLGIYAFTKEFLLKFVELPPTPLMQAESLEQLRILEHGYTMAVIATKYPSLGPNVNTRKTCRKSEGSLLKKKKRTNRNERRQKNQAVVILSRRHRGHLNQSRGVALWLSGMTGARYLKRKFRYSAEPQGPGQRPQPEN